MQNTRIQEIQSKIDAEKAAISKLEATVKDRHLKQVLTLAWDWANDVESFFLRSAREEQRTPDALAKWLNQAEFALTLAAQQHRFVQEVVSKYGPSVQTIGAP